MRLLYIHQFFKFPDECGGTRSYDLSVSFVQKGYDVNVITTTSDIKFDTRKRWSLIERDGLKVHYLYLPYGNDFSYLQRSFVFLRFLWFSTFYLLKLKGDIVLATSTPLTIGVPALIKKWFGRTPFIFEVRDVWPEAVIAIGAIKNQLLQRVLFFLERLIYNNASAIVPLSVDMKSSIVSRFPELKKKPIVVIENIAEISRFQSTTEMIDLEMVIGFKPLFSVLYAGTFGKVNGLDYVVGLAAKTLALEPKLVYLLMGNGAEKEKVSRLATEQGVLNKNVFILDAINKDELPTWYRSVSMGSSFVIDIKELWANSANKFFDTLAGGKPILINHEGWQASTIRAENIGYVLPPQLTNTEVKSFVHYTKQRNVALQQSQNAYEVARKLYALEIASEKYIDIINGVMTK